MTGQKDSVASFYARNAESYCASTGTHPPSVRLQRFVDQMPQAGRVLELGCGSGRDSAYMIGRGIDVQPTDGVPEIAAMATRKLGRNVDVLAFDAIDFVGAFDGIWANACLLHVPRAELAGILEKIRLSLAPGGLFYASYKTGADEGEDAHGRYFNHPQEDWLRQAYGPDWAAVDIETNDGASFDGRPTVWMHVLARAS